MTASEIKGTVEMAAKGDWQRDCAKQTLKLRLAKTTDRHEETLLRIALVSLG